MLSAPSPLQTQKSESASLGFINSCLNNKPILWQAYQRVPKGQPTTAEAANSTMARAAKVEV